MCSRFGSFVPVKKLGFGLAVVVLGCAAGASHANLPANQGPPPAGAPPSLTSPTAATVPTQGSAGPTVASRPLEGGGDVCHGTIDEALQHQLAGRAAQVRFCYERLLKRDARREGRLVVTARLSGTGTIDSASITLDELGDPETSECTLASFKEPLSGAIAGGDCAIVNVPLRFKTKKPDPPSAP